MIGLAIFAGLISIIVPPMSVLWRTLAESWKALLSAPLKEVFSEAGRLSRKGADPLLLASSLTGLGQIERDLNNNDAALQHYGEVVGILKAEPSRLLFAHTIRHLADILREDGYPEEAAACYEEALEVYRQHAETPPLDLANTLRGFALVKGGW